MVGLYRSYEELQKVPREEVDLEASKVQHRKRQTEVQGRKELWVTLLGAASSQEEQVGTSDWRMVEDGEEAIAA